MNWKINIIRCLTKRIILVKNIAVIVFLILIHSKTAMAWDFMFSNLDYQKNIEVQTYLLNKDQVVGMFLDDDKTITQYAFEQIEGDPYLVLRFKNNGKQRPYKGTLSVSLGLGQPVNIKVLSLGFAPVWTTYVLQLTDAPVRLTFENEYPKISFVWDELFVK